MSYITCILRFMFYKVLLGLQSAIRPLRLRTHDLRPAHTTPTPAYAAGVAQYEANFWQLIYIHIAERGKGVG
jgi:hypothetical protein